MIELFLKHIPKMHRKAIMENKSKDNSYQLQKFSKSWHKVLSLTTLLSTRVNGELEGVTVIIQSVIVVCLRLQMSLFPSGEGSPTVTSTRVN